MRYRWFIAKVPNGMSLVEKINNFPKEGRSDQSFYKRSEELSQSDDYKFTWNSELNISNFNEQGDVEFRVVKILNHIDFSIVNIDKNYLIRLINPARSVKELFDALERLIGLGFSCKVIKVDPSKWREALPDDLTAKLVGMEVSDLVINNKVIAKAQFKAINLLHVSPEDIKILEGSSYRVSAVKLDVNKSGQKSIVELKSSGMVKIEGKLDKYILNGVEQYIRKLMLGY